MANQAGNIAGMLQLFKFIAQSKARDAVTSDITQWEKKLEALRTKQHQHLTASPDVLDSLTQDQGRLETLIQQLQGATDVPYQGGDDDENGYYSTEQVTVLTYLDEDIEELEKAERQNN